MKNSYLLMLCAAAGLAVTGVSGFTVIPFLQRLNFGASINEPIFRKSKRIPTMGGIMLALGTLCSLAITIATDKLSGGDIISSGTLAVQNMYSQFFGGIITAFASLFVGLIDDYARIMRNSQSGMMLPQRHTAIFFVALSFLLSVYMGANGRPYMFIPFCGMISTGFLFWIFGITFIFLTAEAVNLSDGIDGICKGTALTACIFLGIIAGFKGYFGAAVICSSLAGALTGFLLWSGKTRLGSTGKFFIGSMLVAISYYIGCPLVLFLCAPSYFVIGICEIIRVLYYKLSDGKRLFKAYPLDRHLSECGISDKKIILIFIAIDIIGGIAAVGLLKIGGFFR